MRLKLCGDPAFKGLDYDIDEHKIMTKHITASGIDVLVADSSVAHPLILQVLRLPSNSSSSFLRTVLSADLVWSCRTFRLATSILRCLYVGLSLCLLYVAGVCVLSRSNRTSLGTVAS